MGWKEKVEEIVERKKARAYFRSHNNEIIQGREVPLLLLVGVAAGLVVALVFELIMNNIGWYLEIAYIIIGLVVADAICRKSNIHSRQVAALSAAATVLAFVLQAALFAFLYYGDLSYFFPLMFESFFAIIMKILSVIVAYWAAL